MCESSQCRVSSLLTALWGRCFNPILQMRRLMFKELKWLAPRNKAIYGQIILYCRGLSWPVSTGFQLWQPEMSPDIAKCPGAERMAVTSWIWTADLKGDQWVTQKKSWNPLSPLTSPSRNIRVCAVLVTRNGKEGPFRSQNSVLPGTRVQLCHVFLRMDWR